MVVSYCVRTDAPPLVVVAELHRAWQRNPTRAEVPIRREGPRSYVLDAWVAALLVDLAIESGVTVVRSTVLRTTTRQARLLGVPIGRKHVGASVLGYDVLERALVPALLALGYAVELVREAGPLQPPA